MPCLPSPALVVPCGISWSNYCYFIWRIYEKVKVPSRTWKQSEESIPYDFSPLKFFVTLACHQAWAVMLIFPSALLQVIWRHRRHQTICSVKPQQCFPPELFMPWQLLWAIFNISWAETTLCSKFSLSIASKGKDWRLILCVIIWKMQV